MKAIYIIFQLKDEQWQIALMDMNLTNPFLFPV